MTDARIAGMEAVADGAQSQVPPPSTTASQPPAAPAQPEDPVKPQILGINLVKGLVVSTIGEAELDKGEIATVGKIALKAFRRMLDGVLEEVGKGVPSKRKRRSAPALNPDGTPRPRRGRPSNAELAARAAQAPTEPAVEPAVS